MRRMAALALVAALAGCGNHPDIQLTNLPLECIGAPNRVLKALERAPNPVRLQGKAISQ
jgi:hypothetical protein